jgi:hypothetical protein
MSKQRAAISMRLLASAGLVRCQMVLGTTPNIPPPSNLKLPASIGCKTIVAIFLSLRDKFNQNQAFKKPKKA